MADDIDIANDLIDNEVTRALNRMRKQVSVVEKGAEFCIECGDAIPKGRQQLGYKLCVPCAEDRERRQSLFADS